MRGVLVLFLLAGLIGAAALVPTLSPVRAAPKLAPAPNHIVISQFRSRGPNGDGDEFVELFNPTNAPISIDGWVLQRSGDCVAVPSPFYTFKSGVSLPAGGHYLIGGLNYSGTGTAAPDNVPPTAILLGDQGGIALFDTPAHIVDAVGMCNATSFLEGEPLAPLSGASDQSYARISDASTGECVDTNNNAADFFRLSPSDPQNSKSPLTKCGNTSFTLTKSIASGSPYSAAGGTIGYSYLVSYAGLVPIAGPVTVTDNKATVTCPNLNTVGNLDANLDPGESLTCTASYTVTSTDLAIGSVTNTANAHVGVIDSNTGSQTAIKAPPTSTPTATPVPFYTYHNIIINEVGWAGTQYSSSDQWIELFNNTLSDIVLDGWQLFGENNTLGTNIGNTQAALNLTGTIPSGGYFIIAKRSDVFKYNGTTYATVNQVDPNLNLYQCPGCGGYLQLKGPSSFATIDSANYYSYYIGAWPAGSLSNQASMERACPAPPVHLPAIIPDDSQNAWFTYAGTPGSIKDQGGNPVYGTPGQGNWACGQVATPSPVPTRTKRPTPIPPKPYAHMVINEFLPRAGYDWNGDGSVDVYDEFIEVENLGPIAGTLSGWKLDLQSFAGNSSYALPSKTLQPGERVVYYGSVSHILLHDSGGTVRLLNPSGAVIDARGYDVVTEADQSYCRIPDGNGYWTHPCFPTPGNQNALTGTIPSAPPAAANLPPVCQLPDTAPDAFRLAECNPFGADVMNPKYWDDQAGQGEFIAPDAYNKWHTVVQ